MTHDTEIASVNAKCEEISKYTEKLFGPGKGIKVEMDWDSFDKAEYSKDDALDYATSYTGYYSVENVKTGCYRLSAWEEDEIVDAVAEGVKKIVMALEPGRDTEKKRFEFANGTLTLYCVFEAKSWSGVYDESDIRSVLTEAGLAAKPEMKIDLLASICQNYWTRWGYYSSLKKIVNNEGLFKQPAEDEVKGINDKGFEGSYVKLFDQLTKINRHGSKQKRNLLITSQKYYTYESTKGKIKEDNFAAHTYGDVICVDLYPLSSGPSIGAKEYGFSIYTNEVKEKKPGFFSKFGVKLPGVKIPLPSVSMPSVSMPSVDMPSVDLPSISMPSMPSISLPDLPEVDISNPFKRHKEPKPKRSHPVTKEKRFFHFIVKDGSTNDKNVSIQEAAWVFFAGYSGSTHRSEPLPFYLDKKQVFDKVTELEEGKRPKLEAQKVEG